MTAGRRGQFARVGGCGGGRVLEKQRSKSQDWEQGWELSRSGAGLHERDSARIAGVSPDGCVKRETQNVKQSSPSQRRRKAAMAPNGANALLHTGGSYGTSSTFGSDAVCDSGHKFKGMISGAIFD